LREASAHGNPQDRAFPSNRALVLPSHRPPPARSTPPTTPSLTHQPEPPYSQTPAAPTGHLVCHNSTGGGRLNRRTRGPNSPQELLLLSTPGARPPPTCPSLPRARGFTPLPSLLGLYVPWGRWNGEAKARRLRRKRGGGTSCARA